MDTRKWTDIISDVPNTYASVTVTALRAKEIQLCSAEVQLSKTKREYTDADAEALASRCVWCSQVQYQLPAPELGRLHRTNTSW